MSERERRSQRVVAIVQARTASTRLPGKVFEVIRGRPMLAHVIARVQAANSVDDTVIATTTETADDPIVQLAHELGAGVTRGSEFDLLARYQLAAAEHRADIIVRITSDCPLIDPDIIDSIVGALQSASSHVDYAANSLPPRTFPRGLDVEVFSREALERAARDDTRPESREHVTPYIYRNPDQFKLLRIAAAEDHSAHRWTVDDIADLQQVRAVYDAVGRDDFGWRTALAVVQERPEISRLNAGVVQKTLS